MQTRSKSKQVIFVDIDKLILKFIWAGKRPRVANTTLTGKDEVGGLTLPKNKTYYKATVIRTVVFWQKNTQ